MMFPMKWKVLLAVLLSLVMVMGTVTTSCKSTSVSSKSDNSEFEIIRQAADAWANNGKPIYYSAKEMYDQIMKAINLTDYIIEWYDPLTYQNGPLIIDVRSGNTEQPDPYTSGHIPGSFSIPWRSIADSNSLRKLDKSRQLAMVSDTGMTGAMATAILGVLGYNTYDLEWGMTAWTGDSLAAPGRYDEDRDTVWNWGGRYRFNPSIDPQDDLYEYPIIDNTKSKDTFDILQAAAMKWLSSGKRENMSAAELFHALHFVELYDPIFFFTNPVTPTENPFDPPFILDVRDDEAFQRGHLYGVLHFYYKDLFKPEALKNLPPDRQILVYSDTGHESGAMTALLCMLGYDAINLKWGITGWSESLPRKDVDPNRFNAETDVMNYTILTGYQSYLSCPG
jgi:rhodanese-related sulfurtransferase